MTNEYSGEPLKYIPVQVTGRLLGIPASDVMQIHHLGKGMRLEDASGNGQTIGAGAIAIADLRQILTEPLLEERGGFAVMASSPHGLCGILVDAVQPIHIAPTDSQSPMPYMLSGAPGLFKLIVREAGQLVLILDVQRLAGLLQAVTRESEEKVADAI